MSGHRLEKNASGDKDNLPAAPPMILRARSIVFAIRAVLGAIFLYAGIIKAGASEQFAMALVPFTFFPAAWIGTFAVVLAWTEITAGVLILLPRVHAVGTTLIALLSILFIATLAWALFNGLIVDCACFGADETPSAFKMFAAIARDALLLLLAVATLLLPRAAGRRQP